MNEERIAERRQRAEKWMADETWADSEAIKIISGDYMEALDALTEAREEKDRIATMVAEACAERDEARGVARDLADAVAAFGLATQNATHLGSWRQAEAKHFKTLSDALTAFYAGADAAGFNARERAWEATAYKECKAREQAEAERGRLEEELAENKRLFVLKAKSLEEEVGRLSAALERIENGECVVSGLEPKFYGHAREIARQALDAKARAGRGEDGTE